MKSWFLAAMLFAVACGETERQINQGNNIEDIPEAKTEIYKYAAEVIPSELYTVTVNGQDAFVLPTIEHHVCTFAADGAVVVKVKSLAERVKSVKVLPVSREYKHRLDDQDLTLILSPGDRVALEYNGKEDHDLFIFVNPIDTQRPDKNDPNVLYFEEGTVTKLGTLGLKAGQTLYVEGGGIVVAALTAGSKGVKTSNITLAGGGIIDSRGTTVRGIQFRGTDNLEIRDLTIINNINWTTFINESEGVKIDNFKVVAVENPNHETGCENDALDILGCKDVEVKGCFGYAHDDIFCVKAHKWDYKGVSENILFEDCIAWNYLSGNCFVIGAETNEPISKVTYRNCVSIHSGGRSSSLFRAGLAIHHCAGGHISDVLFENMVLEDCKEFGIHLDIRESYVKNLGDGVDYSPGTIDNITLRNISLLKAPKLRNVLSGYDNNLHRLKGISLENITQDGTKITQDNIRTYFTIFNSEYTVK